MDEEQAERETLKSDAEQLLADICLQISQVVDEHAVALVVNRRKLVRQDEYGVYDYESWWAEARRFCSVVLWPTLRSRDNFSTEIGTLNLNWVLNTSDYPDASEYVEIIGDISGYFEEFVLLKVLELVAEQDENSIAEAVDVSFMSPEDFENYCAQQLDEAGWTTQIQGGSGDQGVDVIAIRDELMAVFQCKLYSSPLGNKPVQEVHTGKSIYNADVAAVVSNAPFTDGARVAARLTGVFLLHYSELHDFLNPG